MQKQSPSKPRRPLAKKLGRARAKTGETLEEFSKRLGVPVPTYTKWEYDQRVPRGLALEALNAKLDAILKA